MTQYSLSTKLLEYVHFGVPLIAARIPTYLEYFPAGCAWYFDPDDAADAARAIADFAAATPAARKARAEAAQQAGRELVWSKEADRLRQVYERLLGQEGGSEARPPSPR